MDNPTRYQRRNYQLDAETLAAVEQAFQHDKRSGVRLRCQAMLALHRGHGAREVAALCGVEFKTIYLWHDRFTQGGIEALADGHHPGRPPKATPAYCAALEEALAQSPADYGYGFTLWTVDRLVAHLLQQTGIRLSPRGLHALLERLGYSYMRPKQSLKHLQDAEAVAQAQANWERLKGAHAALASPTATNWSPWTKQP